MRRLPSAVFAATLALGSLPSWAQQKAADAPHAAATFDAAVIRRQAAQLAEFRALLADPDPNVRLLTLREAFRAGDAVQRQIAIEIGLASSESAMIEVALRGMLANTQQVIIGYLDSEGKPIFDGGVRLTITKFDGETGHLEGSYPCYADRTWSGQLQGTVFTFSGPTHYCSGNLSWSSETGDFRGHINMEQGAVNKTRSVVWKPQ